MESEQFNPPCFSDGSVKPINDVKKMINLTTDKMMKKLIRFYADGECDCPDYECEHIREIQREVYEEMIEEVENE